MSDWYFHKASCSLISCMVMASGSVRLYKFGLFYFIYAKDSGSVPPVYNNQSHN